MRVHMHKNHRTFVGDGLRKRLLHYLVCDRVRYLIALESVARSYVRTTVFRCALVSLAGTLEYAAMSIRRGRNERAP